MPDHGELIGDRRQAEVHRFLRPGPVETIPARRSSSAADPTARFPPVRAEHGTPEIGRCRTQCRCAGHTRLPVQGNIGLVAILRAGPDATAKPAHPNRSPATPANPGHRLRWRGPGDRPAPVPGRHRRFGCTSRGFHQQQIIDPARLAAERLRRTADAKLGSEFPGRYPRRHHCSSSPGAQFSVGSVRERSFSQPSFSSLMCSSATPLPPASRSGRA